MGDDRGTRVGWLFEWVLYTLTIPFELLRKIPEVLCSRRRFKQRASANDIWAFMVPMQIETGMRLCHKERPKIEGIVYEVCSADSLRRHLEDTHPNGEDTAWQDTDPNGDELFVGLVGVKPHLSKKCCRTRTLDATWKPHDCKEGWIEPQQLAGVKWPSYCQKGVKVKQLEGDGGREGGVEGSKQLEGVVVSLDDGQHACERACVRACMR